MPSQMNAFARNRLSSHFVYESFCEKTKFFFNRASVGFVLYGAPIVGASIAAQNEIAEFLKEPDNLPPGSSLQVSLIGFSFIEPFINNWQSWRKEEIFAKLAKRRGDFFRAKAANGEIKDVCVLIAVTIPATEVVLSDMERRRELLKSTFKEVGLQVKDLMVEELLTICRLWFDWEIASHPEYNPYQLISEQILASDFALTVNSDELKLASGKAMVALEAVKRPVKWKLSLMDLFLGNEMRRGDQITADFIISFGLQILPNQTLEKSRACTKREALMKNLKSGFLKWFPDLEQEYQDLDDAVVAIQDGERLVNIFQNVILKDHPDKIKAKVYEYRSMLRRCGFHFLAATYDHLPVMLACLPMQLVEAQ